MATYATLTIDAADIIGADFDASRCSAWIETNTPDGLIVVDAEHVRLGGRRENPDSNGTITFANLVTTDSADNPTSFGYRVTIVYVPKGSRKQGHDSITTSDFPLTGNVNLASIPEAWDNITAPPSWRSDFLDTVQALRDEAAAAAALAEAFSGLAGGESAVAASVNRRGVLLADYPREGDETHDSPRLERAIAASVVNGSRTVIIPAGGVSLGSTVTISADGVRLVGLGWQSTITVSGDFIGLEITGEAVELHDLVIGTPQSNRTVFPVRTTNCARPYFNHIFFAGQTNSRFSGVFLNGGSEARFESCLFNHACARVETYDVKFDSCYIWAMTCDYGIALLNGAGNLTVNNCDFVPPLRSHPDGKAGIWIPEGLQTKIIGCYLDGNGGLQTREGIMTGDGAGQILIQGVTSNNMASDCIVVDSSYNVLIDGYSGYSNNRHANNSREIVVRQTGVQPIQNVRITNAQFLQTQPVQDGGTAQAAIEVQSGVSVGEVNITGCDIKHPGGSTGYSTPEIKVPVSGGYPTQSIDAHGVNASYSAVGSVAVASGDAAATVNLAAPNMAYRARPGQITFQFEGVDGQVSRVQYASDNQLYVPFRAALTGAGTLHWRVDLRR